MDQYVKPTQQILVASCGTRKRGSLSSLTFDDILNEGRPAGMYGAYPASRLEIRMGYPSPWTSSRRASSLFQTPAKLVDPTFPLPQLTVSTVFNISSSSPPVTPEHRILRACLSFHMEMEIIHLVVAFLTHAR